MSDWQAVIKMELPVTNADGSVDRTVVVTSHYYTERVHEMFRVEEFDGNRGLTRWASQPIDDVAKAFQLALDRAAYGLRVQNRRK